MLQHPIISQLYTPMLQHPIRSQLYSPMLQYPIRSQLHSLMLQYPIRSQLLSLLLQYPIRLQVLIMSLWFVIFMSMEQFSAFQPQVPQCSSACSWLGGGLGPGLFYITVLCWRCCSGQRCSSRLKVLLDHHLLKLISSRFFPTFPWNRSCIMFLSVSD